MYIVCHTRPSLESLVVLMFQRTNDVLLCEHDSALYDNMFVFAPATLGSAPLRVCIVTFITACFNGGVMLLETGTNITFHVHYGVFV